MKKKSIISAILATCMAFSAIGAITASADDYYAKGYDAYTMGSYISGQKYYKGYGVADGRRAAVISGFLRNKNGQAAWTAYGNAYQKVTNNAPASQSYGRGSFTFYNYQTGTMVPHGCSPV